MHSSVQTDYPNRGDVIRSTGDNPCSDSTSNMKENPATSPEVELKNVQEELHATRRKLERYTDLIAKLYDELDNLRHTISNCDKCKRKAMPSTSGGRRSPSPVPLWRRVLRRRKGPARSPVPSTFSSSSLGDLRMPTRQSIDMPSTVKLLPVLPTAATSIVPQHSEIVASDYPEPITTVSPSTAKLLPSPDDSDNSLELKPDWSVEYNPDIQQILDLSLAETLTFDQVAVLDVKFSRNGKYLAVALKSGETHIYDLKTLSKSVLAEHTWMAKENISVRSIQFSQDDVYIATGLDDSRIKIWNVARKRVRAVFRGHTGNVFSVDFSPNGRFLVSASWDHTVRLWCMRDGSSRILSDFALMFNSAVFSPHGRYVFAGNDDRFLRIWDTRTDKLVEKWEGATGRVWCVALSKDGNGLLSGADDGILKYWDVSRYELGSASPIVNTEEKKEILRFEGHTGFIISTAFSSDGRWIFSGSEEECNIRIWDAKTAAWQCNLRPHERPMLRADFSPSGQLLVSGSEDGSVRLWKLKSK